MQIYMKAELELKLREASRETGTPMSQLLAEALEAYFGPNDSNEEIKMAYNPIKKEILGRPVADLLETIPGVQRGVDEGLPCCKKRSPCRHWSFNDLEVVWKNSLTGETRET